MSADPVNYVLIDYENVQPKDLDLLKEGSFGVKIFLGRNQSKIPVDLATALQPLGNNVEYVRLEANGSNALDFHIAYYVGKLSCGHPATRFYIISKDQGFDPLIEHLKERHVHVQRAVCVADMACFKPRRPPTIEAQAEAAISNLIGRNSSRPATMKALHATLRALFKKSSEDQVLKLIAHLTAKGIVKDNGKKLSYNLPIRGA
jgi:hypothetical protein